MKLWKKAALLGAVAGGTLFVRSQNKRLRATPWTIKCPDLPKGFSGMRVLLISDLHAATFGRDQKDLLDLVDHADADLVLITGDLIDRRRTVSDADMRPALTLLKELAKRLPTIRVDGNHEAASVVGRRFRAFAARTGAHDITDRTLTLRRKGDSLTLIGVPDIASFYYNHDKWAAHLHTLCAPHKHTFRIALSHRPQYFPDYVAEGLPLTLCGHAHGGQVRLPLIGGLYAPEQGIFPKYTAGKYRENGRMMVVSRGLGNSGFPLRFNNRPEVCLLTFVKMKDET